MNNFTQLTAEISVMILDTVYLWLPESVYGNTGEGHTDDLHPIAEFGVLFASHA